MPYLVNPAGRTIEVPTLEELEQWLQKPGFRKPTDIEEEMYLNRRRQKIEMLKDEAETLNSPEGGVYLATVNIGGKDGYGTAANHILNELQAQGLKISTFQKNQKIGLLFHSPQALVRLENPFKIVYTMFESDKIPDEWKDYLADADLVLVPSTFCMEVFAKAGVQTEVVPLGFDHHTFTPQERPLRPSESGDFVFLHYNAFNIRKGFLEVYKAFKKAFDPSEPVKMVFKTNVTEPYARFPYITPDDPKIKVIQGGLADYDLVKLLKDSDCFVFPSRGEGFGITPLEAMGTGLPAIVPNAHGIAEYFNDEYMYEVKVKEKCGALYSRYKGQDVGDMVVCDVDDLAQKMRYVYEHPEEARIKGAAAAEYVKRFTFEKTAEKLNKILTEYLAKEVINKPVMNILPLEEVK